MSPFSILAIDPGVTTGIAWRDFSDNDDLRDKPQTAMPYLFDDCAQALTDHLDWEFNKYGQPDLAVIEKFTINAGTAQKSTAGSSVAIELIGIVRYLCWKYEIPLEEQKPADAKNFCDDKKLRRIGWYTPGPDHARDAMRHLLLAAVRHDLVNLNTLLPST